MQKQEKLRRQNSGATPYSKQNSQLMHTSEKPPLQRSQTNAERERVREFMVDLQWKYTDNKDVGKHLKNTNLSLPVFQENNRNPNLIWFGT